MPNRTRVTIWRVAALGAAVVVGCDARTEVNLPDAANQPAPEAGTSHLAGMIRVI